MLLAFTCSKVVHGCINVVHKCIHVNTCFDNAVMSLYQYFKLVVSKSEGLLSDALMSATIKAAKEASHFASKRPNPQLSKRGI